MENLSQVSRIPDRGSKTEFLECEECLSLNYSFRYFDLSLINCLLLLISVNL
jgi:hypothetical protein